MSVEVCTRAEEFRLRCRQLREEGRSLGFVPTMGALHVGHRALMKTARQRCDALAVSIFVNPTQFSPGEDFDRYPRPLEEDLSACAEEGARLVFVPDTGEMYSRGAATKVSVSGLTERLCGASRPGHFDGVALVVTKLLSLAGPCRAVFGRKDYQQLQVIRRLVADLMLPTEIVEQPIERDADGLATSSRNRYLSAAERRVALAIPRALATAARVFEQGERDPAALLAAAGTVLGAGPLRLEYLELLGALDLSPWAQPVASGAAGLFVAARCGATRLIDNFVFGVDEPPRVEPG